MSAPNQTPAGRDSLANLGIAALVLIALVGLLLRLAGTVAAFLTGQPQPSGSWASGISVLAHPTDPGTAIGCAGLSPIAYWITAGILIVGAGALAAWLWSTIRNRTQRAKSDPRRIAGTASRDEVRMLASGKALLKRGSTLRPSITSPKTADVGYLLGTAHGIPVWASVEDSILLIGPPRSGKGLHIVINAILDAPGAVVTTSTRPDNLTVTMKARQEAGPIAVFDPQHLAEGLPSGLRWSPVRGCEQPLTAMIRATGLASATGLGGGGVENGGFWEGKTRTALQALLHAAALDGRDAAEVFRWTLDPMAAADAVTILRTSPGAATGWAESLDATIHSDPRTRDSIWQGVSLSLSALADPRVLQTVSPGPGEQFDPATFLANKGTLYLLATGAGAGASAALVAAFVEDLVETARHLAARSPGARIDPPLLLALDEIGNLAPLPSLPILMAEGGGTGITTMPVLQSLAQARDKWGQNAAGAIWDASIVKIILGGASSPADLRDISTLIGERDETTVSDTRSETGGLSTQRSIRRVPIMPPEAIRTLPFGTGVTLLRSTRPIITDLRPWPKRPDGKQLAEDRAGVERQLRPGS
ncbi:MAG: TraM recognition domain-containing protein [Bifidobacteriaceae bacterium]|jgi:type IV secretory pathway TraG/TraD family ATPase VirD4|nr:TraM recognition domain-containing protein [Bifidobacteriaceae bacterium]